MNNQSIQVFDFEEHEVRITGSPQEPMFVASDVARALDYRDANKATRLLDEDEKGTHKVGTPGGEQEVNVVNEAGLYSLIFRSNKPEARKFKRWVTHEVLPAIREKGFYGDGDPEQIYQSLVNRLKKKREELYEEAEELHEKKLHKLNQMRAVDARLLSIGYTEVDHTLSLRDVVKRVNKDKRASKYAVETAVRNGKGIDQFRGVKNWRSVKRWRDKVLEDQNQLED